MARTDKPILVFQTDFTYAEESISSIYGVVKSVDRELEIFDGTREIPRFDTWSASYRLYQSIPFWPKGTIYVSVVDPGVGTRRRACAAKTADGHIVITPDNGTLTHVLRNIGITEVREIDESVNRYPYTRRASVFAGRDVFGYTAARLASGEIMWEDVGPSYPVSEIVVHKIPEPSFDNGQVSGIVEIVDPTFGNAWTTIGWGLLVRAGIAYSGKARVSIGQGYTVAYEQDVAIHRSYGYVGKGEPVVYCNEVQNVGIALNQESFAETYGIGFGPDWHVTMRKADTSNGPTIRVHMSTQRVRSQEIKVTRNSWF